MFIQHPTDRLKNTHPLRGVGVNDAPYKVTYIDPSSKRSMRCPYYETWQHMLQRCYSAPYQQKNPTYVGCTVDSEWHSFMAFRQWMGAQDWKGKELDKDILVPHNKVYGPETCIFISKALNQLLTLAGAARGALPLGVSRCSGNKDKPFQATIKKYGRKKFLGRFETAEGAHAVYVGEKLAYINELAEKESDPRVKAALLRMR
jgi:hypothetical protein